MAASPRSQPYQSITESPCLRVARNLAIGLSPLPGIEEFYAAG